MKKLLISIILIPTLLILAGCSETVPPGYTGIVVPKEGGISSISSAGRTTAYGYDKLVLIETASKFTPRTVEVRMTDSKVDENGERLGDIGLDMNFIVNVRYRLNSDEATLKALIDDTLLNIDGTVGTISIKDIYDKYGVMVVDRVSREVLGSYTPEEVMLNFKEVNVILDNAIKSELENSPIIISSATLGKVTLPPVIAARINDNYDAELSKTKKSIQQQIALTDEANKAALATQIAKRENEEASSLAAQNEIIGNSLSPELLEFRRIQQRSAEIEMMRESLSNDNNKSTIFIPYGQMDSVGVQNRMFQK